ncbi:hypothetical protein [Sphingobacterium cellulitidis]|uniref:hypothetical protein n=1 Tax=Sphingobacterium cellulitidis TaxID=1768011 RepID=UPI003C7D4BF1
MENPVISEIISFIQGELDAEPIYIQEHGYGHIICPNLSFDIFITEDLFIEVPETDKRYIMLSAGQLEQQSEKIKNRLKVLAGQARKVHARNTVVARVDKGQGMSFQEEHHLQVALPGKYRYGLFHEGELVSLAIFSAGRKMRDKAEGYRSFELLRFCHKSDYLIIGGLSKLIRRFITEFQPGDIMTYVDKDWSQDSSLKTIGFEEAGVREGGKYWISDNQQFQIGSLAELKVVEGQYPEGYLTQNTGSIKLVLAV